jgi:hypothetical protein
MIFFSPFGHNMKKTIMVKVGFCKTFGINNIVNSIITSLVSYQMRHDWMAMLMEYQLRVQISNLGKFPCGHGVC